jgi:hypothetical protein
MPKVPLPTPRPDYFVDTLQRMKQGESTDLTHFIQQLMIQEALNLPFSWNFKEPVIREITEPTDPKPVPLLSVTNEPASNPLRDFESRGDFEYDYAPDHGYHRIGIPEAMNPRTFMSRFAEAMDTNPDFNRRWDKRVKGAEDMMPQVDEAEAMVKDEIDNKGD